MAKETIDLVFENMVPQVVERHLAIALVKQRADCCLLWTDFGYCKVFKYQILDILEGMKEEAIEIAKVPHFTTYRFRRVPAASTKGENSEKVGGAPSIEEGPR